MQFSKLILTAETTESIGELISARSLDILLIVGMLLAFSHLGEVFSDRIKSPHVVGYIVLGLLMGQSFLNLVTPEANAHLEIVSVIALAMIGFTIGGELVFHEIKLMGRTIPIITFFATFVPFATVLWLTYYVPKHFPEQFPLLADFGLPPALIFASLAAATAPAATVSVLWQYNARGPLTTTIFAVVGLDDVLALIIYAFASSYAKMILLKSESIPLVKLLSGPLIEIFGSIIVGAVIGFAVHYASKNITKHNQRLLVTLGSVLMCAGIARSFHLSMLLTSMSLGMTLINISPRNRAIFDEIQGFAPPFYVLMFVIVGTHLNIWSLPTMGLIGLIYIIGRIIGKVGGAYIGGIVSKADPNITKYLGISLLSQAGVAIGLAIEAAHSFRLIPGGEKLAHLFIAVVAATVFVFEIIGPPLVKTAITKAKEADPGLIN